MTLGDISRCSKCVTPATWPGIRFDKEGVCQYCRRFERRWGKWLRSPRLQAHSREKVDRIISKAKGPEYDVLVPVSGGKDSLYVLWWIARHHRVRVLAYTYDNGLMDPRALANIRLAVSRLSIPHVMETLPFQRELLAHMLRRSGNFCGACVIPYLVGSHRIARKYKIPLLVFGLVKRLDPNPPDGMNPFFFYKVVEDGFGKERFVPFWGRHPVRDYLIDSVLGRHKVITLPDYLPWDETQITEELTRELGVSLAEEHFDCIGHEIAGWLTKKRYGFGPLVVKLSKQIRCGLIKRDEALSILEQDTDEIPSSISEVASILGMSEEQIVEASRKSMRPYFKGLGNFIAIQHRKWFMER